LDAQASADGYFRSEYDAVSHRAWQNLILDDKSATNAGQTWHIFFANLRQIPDKILAGPIDPWLYETATRRQILSSNGARGSATISWPRNSRRMPVQDLRPGAEYLDKVPSHTSSNAGQILTNVVANDWQIDLSIGRLSFLSARQLPVRLAIRECGDNLTASLDRGATPSDSVTSDSVTAAPHPGRALLQIPGLWPVFVETCDSQVYKAELADVAFQSQFRGRVKLGPNAVFSPPTSLNPRQERKGHWSVDPDKFNAQPRRQEHIAWIIVRRWMANRRQMTDLSAKRPANRTP
jgi:hypothetical protein